jgi:hypothetical protein
MKWLALRRVVDIFTVLSGGGMVPGGRLFCEEWW